MILYFLVVITLIVFPIIILLTEGNSFMEKLYEYKMSIIYFFCIHNFLFLLGLSLKGDHIDYFIFSLEYSCINWLMFNQKEPSSKILCFIGFGLGLLIAYILPFIILIMSLKSDKTFKYTCNEKTYETRRYSFGGANLDNTTYYFNTYRTLNLIPIEYKIDDSSFVDNETSLSIGEDELKVEIKNNTITFISTNGNKYSKTVIYHL
jgi:hypothetical protein